MLNWKDQMYHTMHANKSSTESYSVTVDHIRSPYKNKQKLQNLTKQQKNL